MNELSVLVLLPQSLFDKSAPLLSVKLGALFRVPTFINLSRYAFKTHLLQTLYLRDQLKI